MLIDAEELARDEPIRADVAVIGSGPAGVTTALDLSRRGIDVVLLESGRPKPWQRAQDLGNAESFDPATHAPMQECTRRQVGGASVIWGGRCLPFDPIDFEDRPHVPNSDWPLGYADIQPYFQRASDYFRSGTAEFDLHRIDGIEQKSIVPGLPDGDVLSSSLERWSLPTNFGREYAKELAESRSLRLVYSATCTEIDVDPDGRRTAGLNCRTLPGGKALRVEARAYVVACGGLDTTRLLMASQRVHSSGIGNHADQLGRYYMGHISGKIANVRFTTPPRRTVYGFDRDAEGVYLRRRFSFAAEFQQRQRLSNIVSFLVNPVLADASHRNGVLSFAFLALASPMGKALIAEAIRKAAIGAVDEPRLTHHVRNMLLDLPRTLAFIPTFGYKRYLAWRKLPSFFQYSASNHYPLHYHGEQVPKPDSRVTLGDERDEHGMRRLRIDLRYCEQDVDTVLRAHDYWHEYLVHHGVGAVEYLDSDVDDRVRRVWQQAGDGFHQAGTTRMSADPARGVVGPHCNVHGFDDLFVASSSNFVTSGQANSTFMIVAFALRLSDHLRSVTLARGNPAGAAPQQRGPGARSRANSSA